MKPRIPSVPRPLAFAVSLVAAALPALATAQVPGDCTPVSIVTQPAPATQCSRGAAVFSVTAAGTGPLTYRWQIETAPGVWATLGNDPMPLPCGGGAFAYASRPFDPQSPVGVHPCAGVWTYRVRSVVSNACSSVNSDAATLTVITIGDINCDCAINNFDIDPFVLALTNPTGYAAAHPGCDINHADVNHDGVINNFDIDPFVVCLVNGGCP